ncbi:MAG: MOSC N-terminal beta barrel domain-containing protein [Actinomycetota bacterium]
MIARIARTNVTPVKSTGLTHSARLRLDRRGVRGNREFVFVQSDGARVSGVSKAALMGIRSTYDPDRDRLTLSMPDGRTVEGDASGAGDAFDVEFYGGITHPVRLLEAPALVDAASGLLRRPLRLGRLARPGHDTIGEPVSLLSLSSVRELARRAGTGEIDSRRFRMLIELEDTEPFAEESWLGRTLVAGDAQLRITRPVSRCVMTTMDPDSGAQDLPTLELLATHKGRSPDGTLTLGVYADVVRPGTLAIGDPVTPA